MCASVVGESLQFLAKRREASLSSEVTSFSFLLFEIPYNYMHCHKNVKSWIKSFGSSFKDVDAYNMMSG